MAFWSDLSIPGEPKILLIDASENRNGWESEFCARLFRSLQRSELKMVGDQPHDFALPEADFSCVLICTHELKNHWDVMKSKMQGRLFAACTWESYDAETTNQILQAGTATFCVVPLSSMTPRESGLFYLKLFTELNLHSRDQISGKMVWFSFSKAKELLRRRRYPGKFGIRC